MKREDGAIRDMACGEDHMVVLTDDQKILVSGHLERVGQAIPVDGREFNELVLHRHPEDQSTIKKVFSGKNTIFVATEANFLYGMGWNHNGVLGQGIDAPYYVRSLTFSHRFNHNIVSFSSGFDLSIAILSNGEGWGCGHTAEANCQGFNIETDQPDSFSFVPLKKDKEDTQFHVAVTGSCHYIVMDQANRCATMGYNYKGQLGVNLTDDKPHDEPDFYIVVAKNSNDFSDVCPIIKQFGPQPTVRLVAAGGHSKMIVTMDNVLYSCGENTYGQLGLCHTDNVRQFCKVDLGCGNPNPVKKIAIGMQHAVILREGNTLMGAGCKYSKEINNSAANQLLLFSEMPSIANLISKIDVFKGATAILNQAGTLYVRGDNTRQKISLLGGASQSTFFTPTTLQPQQAQALLDEMAKDEEFDFSSLKFVLPILIVLVAVMFYYANSADVFSTQTLTQ